MLLLCNTCILKTIQYFTHVWDCWQDMTFHSEELNETIPSCPLLTFHISKLLTENNDFTWKMAGLLSLMLLQRIFKKQSFKKLCELFITSCIPFVLMARRCMIFYNPCNFHYQSASLHFFVDSYICKLFIHPKIYLCSWKKRMMSRLSMGKSDSVKCT